MDPMWVDGSEDAVVTLTRRNISRIDSNRYVSYRNTRFT